MSEEKQESKKETKPSYELVEVPTQTTIAIRNVLSGELLNESQALALILNEIQVIKKAIA